MAHHEQVDPCSLSFAMLACLILFGDDLAAAFIHAVEQGHIASFDKLKLSNRTHFQAVRCDFGCGFRIAANYVHP
jgi:hypothetical protein